MTPHSSAQPGIDNTEEKTFSTCIDDDSENDGIEDEDLDDEQDGDEDDD